MKFIRPKDCRTLIHGSCTYDNEWDMFSDAKELKYMGYTVECEKVYGFPYNHFIVTVTGYQV